MKARRNGFASGVAAPTIGAAALVVVALVAVIGSAQAAAPTKVYTAEVRLTDATTSLNTFTLKLKNISRNNVVGSANFTAPLNFTVAADTQSVSTSGNRPWTITSDGSRLVKFRADTSGDTLKPGESVEAIVGDVTIPSGCSVAAWTTEAKQSNDFSSSQGNAIQPDLAASDLVPLGSFAVGPEIVTVQGGQTIPARETDKPFTWTATAKDTCGSKKSNYSGAGAMLTPTLLTDATYVPEPGPPETGLNWEGGVGTVTFTPQVTETGNRLKVADSVTGVNASSTSGGSNLFFDVSDTLCTPTPPGQTVLPCEWKGGKNDGITAKSDPPTTAGANLGIGFNSSLSSPPRANFSCDGGSDALGEAVVNINPRGFTSPFDVSITYKKSISGNGAASDFVFCVSHDGTEWETAPECTSPLTLTPCIKTQKRVTGGDLLFVLTVTQADPWGGAK